jgi:hypothetical protein
MQCLRQRHTTHAPEPDAHHRTPRMQYAVHHTIDHTFVDAPEADAVHRTRAGPPHSAPHGTHTTQCTWGTSTTTPPFV